MKSDKQGKKKSNKNNIVNNKKNTLKLQNQTCKLVCHIFYTTKHACKHVHMCHSCLYNYRTYIDACDAHMTMTKKPKVMSPTLAATRNVKCYLQCDGTNKARFDSNRKF